MNAQPHVESQGLIASVSIEALLAARDEAQKIYFDTAEQLRGVQKRLDQFGVSLPSVGVGFPGAEYLALCDEDNREAINREIDRFVWVRLFELTNIDTIMDHKTRAELFEKLGRSQRYRRRTGFHRTEEKDPEELPELTTENVFDLFGQLHSQQYEYFERCVESVYKAMSWEHATNEPGIVGKRIITTSAFYQWSRSMQGNTVTLGHHEHIHDLERVLCILNGDPPPTHESPGLRNLGAMDWGKWYESPNPNGGDPLLRIKCYRKGTCHIEILNPKHRDDMNRIMAHRYPGSIAPPKGARKAQWGDDTPQRPKTSTALARTDKQARQAFYTPVTLADEVAAIAFPGRDFYNRPKGHGLTVLEPSAGEGSLARAAFRADCLHVTAIENDPHGADMLNHLADRVNGKHDEPKMEVDRRDFFDVTPVSYPKGFNVVMMNPPFSNEQEVEHVLHAWEFVKPGGRLVAIMSNAVTYRSTGRYKIFSEFLQRNGAEIRKNPASSFKESGTNVETVIVIIDKPEA